MIALQISNWNQNRLDRIEENYVLRRIVKELEANISFITGRLEMPPKRREALDRLAEAFAGKPIPDHVSFLNDIAQAGSFGWKVPTIGINTFEELVSSGKLGLIRDDELRDTINQYYDKVEESETRMALRVSGYSDATYKLVPRSLTTEAKVKEGLTEKGYAHLVEAVLESNLSEFILSAQNRNNLIERLWRGIVEDAEEIIKLIEAELAK